MDSSATSPFNHTKYPSRSLVAAVAVIMLMPLVLALFTLYSQRGALGAASTALEAAAEAEALASTAAVPGAPEDAARLGVLMDRLKASPALSRSSRTGLARRWAEAETGLAETGPKAENASRARLAGLAAELREVSASAQADAEAEAERSADAVAVVTVFSVAALLSAAWYTWRKVSTPVAGLAGWVDGAAGTGAGTLPPPSSPVLGPLAQDLSRLTAIVNGRLTAYQGLLDNLALAVFVIDGSGRVVSANARAVECFGAVEGRLPIYGHLPPEDGPMIEESITRLLAGAETGGLDGFTSRTTLHGLDGPRAAELTAVPVPAEEGRPGRVIVAARITTEADRLRVELEKTREEARQNAAVLKEKIRDLEEFTLMAVRRELKMKEIREMLDSSRNRDPGDGGKGRPA